MPAGVSAFILAFSRVMSLDLMLIDDLQEHIARFGFAGDATLIAVRNVFLCNVLTATVHQLQLDSILDGFDSHLCVAFERNMIGDLADQLPVFSVFSVQHRFTDSCCYLLFVESDDTSVTFDNCLNHDKSIIEICMFLCLQKYIV